LLNFVSSNVATNFVKVSCLEMLVINRLILACMIFDFFDAKKINFYFFLFLARGLGFKVKGKVEKQDCNKSRPHSKF